ncbi:hypothetical protein QAD02_015840 [Eretmocerus hayati]|uniref:Uncharacterized protein n=1 Tax=Eretmocerus hayati TaxID=131215 RepID=A0ACC2PAE5_9HYME|nr:hypothetical protein QAD02_015840 [Eretmocerus hayati]
MGIGIGIAIGIGVYIDIGIDIGIGIVIGIGTNIGIGIDIGIDIGIVIGIGTNIGIGIDIGIGTGIVSILVSVSILYGYDKVGGDENLVEQGIVLYLAVLRIPSVAFNVRYLKFWVEIQIGRCT